MRLRRLAVQACVGSAFVLCAAGATGQDAALSESVVEVVPPQTAAVTQQVTEARPFSFVESDDAIDQEMRLHMAIAEGLRGDSGKAIDVLGVDPGDDTAALYSAAMWMMRSGKIDEGVALLEQIKGREDAPAETSKYLAVGYLHLNRPAESEAAAEHYLSQDDDDAYSHYLRGLAMLRQDEPEGAGDALKNAGYDDREVAEIQQVVMQFPVDVAQRVNSINSSQAVLRDRAISGRNLDKNYNFTLLLAGEYDSNVPLQPDFVGLGSAAIDHDDYRVLVASFLDLQLLTCDEFNLGMIGSTYNTFQFDDREFNIQDYMGGAYVNGLLLDNLIGSFRYEYHHTQVDARTFANDHRLTPSLSLLGDRGHTTLYYEFNPIDAHAPALIPAQLQSADIHRVGVTQAIYTFGGDGRIYGGYQFSDASAEGSDFDRSSHMATVRLERPLMWDSIFDLEVRHFWDDYDNPNSLDFYDRERMDRRIELRTGLQKNFNRPVSLRIDYTYINNDSNVENLFGVPFYEYDRHILSTQLIFTL